MSTCELCIGIRVCSASNETYTTKRSHRFQRWPYSALKDGHLYCITLLCYGVLSELSYRATTLFVTFIAPRPTKKLMLMGRHWSLCPSFFFRGITFRRQGSPLTGRHGLTGTQRARLVRCQGTSAAAPCSSSSSNILLSRLISRACLLSAAVGRSATQLQPVSSGELLRSWNTFRRSLGTTETPV